MKRAGSLTIHVVAEAASPFAVFEGWGPRTSKVHPSHRSKNCSHSMFPCRGAFIATTDQDTCTSSLQLLSTAALAKYTAPAHLVSGNSGAGAATVHLRGGRLRGHAGAFPSADQRAGAGKSFYRDAGSKTALRGRFCEIGASAVSAARTGCGRTH